MNIIDRIRQRILHFLHIEHLAENPQSERFTYINDIDEVDLQKQIENWTWYKGDSDELLNYYTNQDAFGFSQDPIYNRNRRNYFWALSATEASIKRVHSGVPRAIVDTLTNLIGTPIVTIDKNDASVVLKKINFDEKINQEQIPFTLVLGHGAFKVIIDEHFDYPIIRFYNGENVKSVCKEGQVIGIIYKDFYRYKDKDYLLLETRRINERGNSCIEYELFRLKANNDVTPVSLGEVPELAHLKDIEIPNYKRILGVASRFFKDPDRPDYGRSIFAGKIDLFDDLDQSLSQRSQTCRVSTPVEYYPADLLKFDRNGNAVLPHCYNRQFMQKAGGAPNGDGMVDAEIQTTQPQLNFEQYNSEQRAILDQILIGILSPATMGIDLSKDDNADAQREKEKVSTMTRNNIIVSEENIIKELMQIVLDMADYMKKGSIDLKEREISVKFPAFANPSFESLSKYLTPMWTAGAISTKMYVEKLYGDSLSPEEKEQEIKWLDENRQQDMLSQFGSELENETPANSGQEEETDF